MFNFLVIYVSTELIYKDFEEFGKIGDFYRPTNLQRGMPSRYAFVRYYNKDDADRASLEMHGRKYGDSMITVDDANLQNSFFTQDTGKIIFLQFFTVNDTGTVSLHVFLLFSGFITNEMFDTPKIILNEFDSTMPPDHYPLKRKQELRNLIVDQQVTLRVDDLHKDIT